MKLARNSAAAEKRGRAKRKGVWGKEFLPACSPRRPVRRSLGAGGENPAKQAKVREYEKQIDQLVYKLYGLTADEIKIVEGEK